MSPVRLTVVRDLARSPRISFSDGLLAELADFHFRFDHTAVLSFPIPIADPTSVNMDVETVELTKINRAGLGLSIVERE